MDTKRGDMVIALMGLGFGLVIGSSVFMLEASWRDLISLGTISAMMGTYLSLMMLLLSSRMPWVEREVGHDRMITLHRKIAPYTLLFIGMHVVCTTIGYSKMTRSNFINQIIIFSQDYPWMIDAIVSAALMIILSVISYKKIRLRMRYEVWWVMHTFFYVSVILAFAHQIVNGTIFIKYPLLKLCWIALYLSIFSVIIISRIIKPCIFSIRHRLVVDKVVQETDDVYSIYINGRNLDELDAHGGQFFQWRFLSRGWWWQSHPYSLSRSPHSGYLRITVKILGDHSYDVARRIKPGTRLFAEGPYGIFTARRRQSNSIVTFAAGIGITPILAMLEEIPPGADVILIYRTSSDKDIVFGSELDELFINNRWRVYYLSGSRQQHPINLLYMNQFIPNFKDRDVYICGSESFTADVITLASNAGVPYDNIYHESFSF